ncbi:MAG: putative ATPase [Anaerolineales bacterium]|nr:putative ATPase [Anaerolineales bacterium]
MTSRPAAPPPAPPPAPVRAQTRPLTVSGAPRVAAAPPVGPAKFVPPPLSRLEDTGLPLVYIADLGLKILYNSGYLTGFQISDRLALPFNGIGDQVLEFLKREKLVEVKGSGGFGEGAYQYQITAAGIARAREAMDRNQYAGAVPVPIHVYNEAVTRQSGGRHTVTQRVMRQALAELVMGEKTFARIGPAANSGTSLFLYGAPGNGKTSIARAIGKMILGEDMYIPYALDVEGQIIKIYDNVNHQVIEEEDAEAQTGTNALRAGPKRDLRWIKIKRPFIVVGGELTMAGLDLQFDEVNKFYEAPFQQKANGGMFLIDDFGRQQIRPRDLLNRWIVPLENRVDFLTLHNGRKIEIPFEVLVVFSTNLPPKDLVDEAFLRRIRHKIEILDPTFEEFREIFRRVALAKKIVYDDKGLAYLLQEWYIKRNRKLRSNHPRDILEQILDISSYLNLEPAMTKDLMDRACESYFVEL